MWTGDTVPHDDWIESEAFGASVVKSVTNLIKEGIPNVPLYFVMGNHEAYPVDRFDFNGPLSNYLYKVLHPLFKDDLDESAYKEFSENLYYS